MSRFSVDASRAAASYDGPPAERMAGRPSRMRSVQASRPPVKAAAVNKQFEDKEEILDHAIHTGVISSGMRDHYSALWEADPKGTQEYLHKLGLTKQGLNPDAAPQKIAAAAEAEAYDESTLTDAERGRIAQARAGGRSAVFISGGL